MNEPISEAELRHIAATRAPDGVKELLLEAADLTARRTQQRDMNAAAQQSPSLEGLQ